MTGTDATELDLRVEPMREQRIEPTARMLAQAFEIDPAYRYMIMHPARRTRGLTDFFTRNLRTHLRYRCTHVATDLRGDLLGTVTLRPPEGFSISTATMVRRGLLPFLLANGGGAVRRMLWLKETYDALEAEAAGHAPHRYVHMMAVTPRQQGRGIGGQLLRHVLGRAPADALPCPTVLTTHLPQNLVFYRRAGFDVPHEQRLKPPGGEPYTVWSMRSD